MLHRFVFNLKRILQKVGLGSRLGSLQLHWLLIKEDKSYAQHKDSIEMRCYILKKKIYIICIK